MDRSDQTKIGIAHSKAKGVQWGCHGTILAAQNKSAADDFAMALRPLILELMTKRRCGPVLLARELNKRKIPARNGSEWHPATVDRLLQRLQPSLSEDLGKAHASLTKKLYDEWQLKPK